jgi:hypothetical protein
MRWGHAPAASGMHAGAYAVIVSEEQCGLVRLERLIAVKEDFWGEGLKDGLINRYLALDLHKHARMLSTPSEKDGVNPSAYREYRPGW